MVTTSQYVRVDRNPLNTIRSHRREITSSLARVAIGGIVGYLTGATLIYFGGFTEAIQSVADLLPKILMIITVIFIVSVLLAAFFSKELAIGKIHVPQELKDVGHTEEFMARRIGGEILAMLDQISEIDPADRSETPSPILAPEIPDKADALDVVVPGTGIRIKTIADYLRRMAYKKPRIASGYIVQLEDKLVMHLDAHNGKSLYGESGDIHGLVALMAEKYLAQARPDMGAAHYSKKGVDHGRRGDFAAAEQAFQKAVELGSRHGRSLDTAHALANWGWALARSGCLEEAEAKFDRAVAICQPRGDKRALGYIYVTWGNALVSADFNSAVDKFREATEADSHYAYAYASWGTALREKDKPREAMKMFWRAHRCKKDYDYPYVDYGITLLDQYGRPRLAERLFRRAIRIQPRHVQARILLGRALAAQGASVKEVAAEFQKAADINPRYAYAYVAWGDLLRERNARPSMAVQKYQKALEIDPKHVRAWTGWADALDAQKDFEGAIAKLRMALAVVPRDDYAMVRWGEVLAKRGDSAGAVARFVDAARMHPEYDYAYLAWGRFLLNVQKAPARAITKFQKALLESKGNHAEVLKELAKAEALLRRARVRRRMQARVLRGARIARLALKECRATSPRAFGTD